MQLKHSFLIILSVVIAIWLLPSSCNKRTFLNTGGSFSFSTDTLTFDTVFTTQGSVTQSFLIKNRNDKWIRLQNIKLGGGDNSAYRLNIDGLPTKNTTNIDIAPFDSVHVFVAITIDPTSADNPFIIEDSVIVTLNNQTKSLPLLAYGQNAIYINDSILQGNITWTKSKPYVIVNSALIDSTAKLTIEPGTRVYMHANSKLFVKGTLKAIGTVSDSIVFCGDRLDRNYFGGDIPGEWCGLHFLQKSKDNELSYCIIKNGGAAWKIYNPQTFQFDYLTGALIYAEPNDAGITSPKVIINNCFVGLSIQFGILAFNSNIQSTNTLYYACGAQNFAALQGGTYNFTHCTFGNYGYKVYLKHDKYSVVALKNYLLLDPTDINTLTGFPLLANFKNCIVDGTATEGNEFFIDNSSKYPAAVNVQSTLLKQKETMPIEVVLDAKSQSLLNSDPKFKKPNSNDFTLDVGSAAAGIGDNLGITIDIKNNTRAVTPSIGCWE